MSLTLTTSLRGGFFWTGFLVRAAVDPTLFAVVAWSRHNRFRKAKRINLFHDLAGLRRRLLDSHKIALPTVPKGAITFTLTGKMVV